MKIIGIDNLDRESIADILLIPWVPKLHKEDDNYRLSKGMEDLV